MDNIIFGNSNDLQKIKDAPISFNTETKESTPQERYEAILSQLEGDEELMLKVLVEAFGGVKHLWNDVHTHITSLEEIDDISEEQALDEVIDLEEAFNTVLSNAIQTEFLTEKINTISKLDEGYKLFLDNGKEVVITNKEVKEKIILQNNQFAFDHFAGLIDEEDLQAVFRIVDLYYVE